MLNIKYFEFFLNKLPLYLNLKKNCPIIGKILRIRKYNVLLDFNLKSETVVSRKEFLNFNNNLIARKGDFIELYIKSLENKSLRAIFSRKINISIDKWRFIIKEYSKNNNLKGVLYKKVKGGYSVISDNIEYFIPYSLLEKRLILNFNYYKNKTLNFRLQRFNLIKKKAILSRKKILKIEIFFLKKIFIKNLKIGTILTGIVKNITNYGIIINLGILDGIILLKNTSWFRNRYNNEIFKINQSVLVRVINIDYVKYRIFLGLRQLVKNPWKRISNVKKNNIKYSRVYKITNYSIWFVISNHINFKMEKKYIYKTFKKKYVERIKINDYLKLKVVNFNKFRNRIKFKIFSLPLA